MCYACACVAVRVHCYCCNSCCKNTLYIQAPPQFTKLFFFLKKIFFFLTFYSSSDPLLYIYSFVSMSTSATPSTPRQNGSPNTNPSSTAPSVTDRKVMDNRPAFTTSSFHAAPFQPGAVRKRRADALGFPVDAGPFFSQTQQHYNVYTMDRSNR
jgi:hypothetical protein